MPTELTEIAYYYPNPIWWNSDWIKNLILFFDGVALLVPHYMRDRPFISDPSIAVGLEEHGLLHIFEPESFIDRPTTEALAKTMTDLLASGALDKLAEEHTAYSELSYSRIGGMVAPELANAIRDELLKRGLAQKSQDGVSLPMHPRVRSLILVLLTQLLRPVGRNMGFDFYPATDMPEVHEALREVLELPSMPSAAHVVSLDLQTVGVDLGSIPIDEVLAFRTQYRDQYRTYAHNIRQFVRTISQLPVKEQQEEMNARQSELTDNANHIRSLAQNAWKRPLAFALGLAGGVWQIRSGDPLGGFLALGLATLAASQSGSSGEAGTFSYLFSAHKRFG